jgi:hypothetical protein
MDTLTSNVGETPLWHQMSKEEQNKVFAELQAAYIRFSAGDLESHEWLRAPVIEQVILN